MDQLKRLKQLEREKVQLEYVPADLALDLVMLQLAYTDELDLDRKLAEWAHF